VRHGNEAGEPSDIAFVSGGHWKLKSVESAELKRVYFALLRRIDERLR